MSFELAILSLFAVATAVALFARRFRVPYTVALVVSGLALGSARMFTPPHLTRELLYAVFLPGLVFEAAFHLEFRKFWQNKLAIHALAVPGVIAAIAITAALLTPAANALHFVEGFGLRHGLVFAAMIAATDPIAVVGLFKSLGVPRRLAVLLEGESLLNDGTGVVLFTLIFEAVSGAHFTASQASLEFLRVVGGGALIGAAVGFTASRLTALIEDPMVEITLTTLAAYGSFLMAERVHFSGVIATVAAGMLCGNYGARVGMSPSTRVAVESFWEYVAFALNSVVFLLLGFEVRVPALVAAWKPILVAYVAVTLGRAIVVAIVAAALSRTRERIPWTWGAVLGWGGLRGALSMVLALALPQSFPHRELIVTMTFGVVVLSILIQGLTMGPLLKRLGLAGLGAERAAHERHRGALLAAKAALQALAALEREGATHPDILASLRERYTGRVAEAEGALREIHARDAAWRGEEQRGVERQLLVVEKDAILRAARAGVIEHEASDALLRDIDARIFAREEEGDLADAPADHEGASR
jgi:CPA1 family monovalent cation:H+ antiporter